MSGNAVSQKTNGDPDTPSNLIVPSSLASDYPGCMAWFKMHEGAGATGTNIADYIGNVANLSAQFSGAGNPWSQGANPGDPIHSDGTASNTSLIRTIGEAPSELQNIGLKSIILEVDLELLNATDSDQIICVGVTNSSSTKGIAILWNGPGTQLQYRVGGDLNSGINEGFSSTPAGLEGVRRHIVVTHERTLSNPGGIITLYIDGVMSESKSMTTDPGVINISGANGRLAVGTSANGGPTDILNAYFYNSRIWYVDGAFPTNMTQIIAQMASMRNEFPPLMAGVS